MKRTLRLLPKKLPLLLAAGFLISSLPSFTVSAKDGSFLIAKRDERNNRRPAARPAARSQARPADAHGRANVRGRVDNRRPAARGRVESHPNRGRVAPAHAPRRDDKRRR